MAVYCLYTPVVHKKIAVCTCPVEDGYLLSGVEVPPSNTLTPLCAQAVVGRDLHHRNRNSVTFILSMQSSNWQTYFECGLIQMKINIGQIKKEDTILNKDANFVKLESI